MYLNNLKSAVLALFTSKSVLEFLINIDRIGNSLCSGDYRATVSARVGFFAFYKDSIYWRTLQKIINETFRPLDGPNHCFNAWKHEGTKKYRRGNDVALTSLSVVVFISCIFIAPVIYLLVKSKIVKPRG